MNKSNNPKNEESRKNPRPEHHNHPTPTPSPGKQRSKTHGAKVLLRKCRIKPADLQALLRHPAKPHGAFGSRAQSFLQKSSKTRPNQAGIVTEEQRSLHAAQDPPPCWLAWPCPPRLRAARSIGSFQIFPAADYSARTDSGYSVPAIPIYKVLAQYPRQNVRFETDEAPGTIIVDTGARSSCISCCRRGAPCATASASAAKASSGRARPASG